MAGTDTVKKIIGKPLINVVRVEAKITEGENTTTYVWDTANKISTTLSINEGQETVLRYKNVIAATNRTEDIAYGIELGLTDNKLQPEVLALIDGGTLTIDSITKKATKYTAPVVGSPVIRKKFDFVVYTEEKDVNNEPVGYAKFTYLNCKGKPVNYNLEDGVFMVPEMTIVSRPPSGSSPYEIEFLDELPAVVETPSSGV